MKQSSYTLPLQAALVGIALAITSCKKDMKSDFALQAVTSEPVTNWDPAAECSNGIIYMNNVYEQLLRFDAVEKKIVPILATEYTVSPDGLTWTFNLRKGVKFHDGTDLDANAVKFSIERTKRLAQGPAYIWDPLASINVLDGLKVEFKLKYQAPLQIIASAGYGAFIYSPKSVGSDDKWFEAGKDCGTGPYKLKSFKWGEEAILERFADYWGGWPEKNIGTVVLKKISEPATRRQMVEKGDASITGDLSNTDVEALKKNADMVVETKPALQNLLLMFNTQRAPLNKPEVRRALSYAFPYKQVVESVMGGNASQSFGMVPEGMWGHSTSLPQFANDPAKAKESLAAAGYPKGGLKLMLTYLAGDEVEKSVAELYKSELAKLGVELELRSMPWDSQWEKAKSTKTEDRQDIFMMYWWPDMPTPYAFMNTTFHSEKSPVFNLAYYYNTAFDTLIDEANRLSATDKAKAEAMFIDAQKKLIDEAVTIPAFDKQAIWVHPKAFKGYGYNPAYQNVIFFHGAYFE